MFGLVRRSTIAAEQVAEQEAKQDAEREAALAQIVVLQDKKWALLSKYKKSQACSICGSKEHSIIIKMGMWGSRWRAWIRRVCSGCGDMRARQEPKYGPGYDTHCEEMALRHKWGWETA